MGRWTWQAGSPLYIPDPGEGGGSPLGHAAMGTIQTLGDAARALTNNPVARSFKKHVLPQYQAMARDVETPARAVVATGHALAGPEFVGKTDPIEYIRSGKGGLSGYGELLADVMSAEGTIDEKGKVADVIRFAGDSIQNPVVLAMTARAAARASALPEAPRAPANSPATPAKPKAPAKPKGVEYRQPPGEGAPPWSLDPEYSKPSVPLDKDLAHPGAFTRSGVGSLPKAKKVIQPLDQDLAYGSGPTRRGLPRVREAPPSQPLDQDLAYGSGRMRSGIPKTKLDRANRQKLKRATKKMGREQLGEGTRAMRREQLDEGVEAMRQNEARPVVMLDQPGPGLSRMQMRALLEAAVMNGATADDVMRLIGY